MENLPVRRLHELCEVTSSKRVYASELSPSGVPFYRSKDIIELLSGKESPSSPLFIPEKRFQEILKLTGAPIRGDVLLTSRGTLGVPYLVRESNRFHFADGNLTWFRNFRNLDSRYLVYYFLSPAGSAELSKCVIGSSQAAYTIASLKNIEIRVPALPVQRLIAGILSAYDDLIEVNGRRIAILEETACRLFNEWFVKLRFPGHQTVSLIDTSDGPMPQGWSFVSLGDVANVQWGDTTKTKSSYAHEGFAAYSATGQDGYLPYFDFDRTGIVLSAIGANCGRTWFASGKWSCIKNTIRFWSIDNNLSDELLFYSTQRADFWPRRGAAQPFISQGDARNCRVLRPTAMVGTRFHAIVGPMLRMQTLLNQQNGKLRAARDLLLPKLISGEIDLSGAERKLEAAQ